MAAKRKTASKKKTPAKKKGAAKPKTKHKPGGKQGPPLGNQYWRLRRTSGRNPIFKTPDELMEAAEKYFEWNDANPVHELQLVTYQGDATPYELPKMRIMTIRAMCRHIGLSERSWLNYCDNPKFEDAIEQIKGVIYDQKLTGAAAGLLNTTVVVRDLGLRDGTDVDVTITPKKAEDLSDDELASIAARGSAGAAGQEGGKK